MSLENNETHQELIPLTDINRSDENEIINEQLRLWARYPKKYYYSLKKFIIQQVKQKNAIMLSKGVFIFLSYYPSIHFITIDQIQFLDQQDLIAIRPYIQYSWWKQFKDWAYQKFCPSFKKLIIFLSSFSIIFFVYILKKKVSNQNGSNLIENTNQKL